MIRWLKRLGWFLLLLVAAFAAFFLWASSGTLGPGAMASTATYAATAPPPPGDTLTVVTYNIGYLSGMTNNLAVERGRALFAENMDKAAALLRATDADIIGFQEIDLGAARSFGVHQVDSLAERLGYRASATAVNWDERYLPFPYWPPAVHFGRVVSGQAVLSRFPIEEQERVVLARPEMPFWRDALYLDRLAQVVHLELPTSSAADSAQTLTVINVHLEAFDEATREEQAAEVRRVVDRAVAEGAPVLLIGDFNSVMPSARAHLPDTLRQDFAGDSTLARLLAPGDLAPAFPDSAYAAGRVGGTYPADAPNRTIDHVFFTPGRIEPLEAEVRCGPQPDPPADHCAVTMRFVLRQ